jgi:hypothetical protein
MKEKRIDLNSISEKELTPLVKLLIQEILYLREENQRLRDEIALLKKGRPQR